MRSVLEAVAQILNRRKRPMKCTKLTKCIIDQGLWETDGKTPDATVGAAIYSEIKEKGENSTFIKVAPGVFGLREKHLEFVNSPKYSKKPKKSKKSKRSKNSKTPKASETPETTEISETSETPETTEISETSETPEISKTLESSEISEALESSEAPKKSKTPKTPKKSKTPKESKPHKNTKHSKSQKNHEEKKQSLSFTDATQKVLDTFAGQEPMHYKEITKKALQNQWIDPSGKTPESSLYAQIISEIRRKEQKGEESRFVKYGRGLIGLSKWSKSDITTQFQENNLKVRKELLSRIIEMSPTEFEELISVLLVDLGFEDVEVTKQSWDGGVDVRGTLVVAGAIRIKMAVQAKKWKSDNKIQSPTVQQLRGSLEAHDRGLIITTSDFTAGAVKDANEPKKAPIALMNGEDLAAILMEHEIGAKQKTFKFFQLDFDSIFSDE